MTTQFFFITELNGMCYFKLLLSVINNNLLIMIKNSKKNKNRERIHEKMGQGREKKNCFRYFSNTEHCFLMTV